MARLKRSDYTTILTRLDKPVEFAQLRNEIWEIDSAIRAGSSPADGVTAFPDVFLRRVRLRRRARVRHRRRTYPIVDHYRKHVD